MFVRNYNLLNQQEMSYIWKFRTSYGNMNNTFYYHVLEREMRYLIDQSSITEILFYYLVSCEKYFGETLIV